MERSPPGREASPHLSVCVATFNGERFVAEQLRSILEQLGPEDEVVISDDGSSDRTLEIVRSFGDSRVRILVGNSFRSAVRNFENALRHASGDVLVLSDQDDVWLPGRLAKIRERFAGSHPPVHLVVLDATVIDESGATLHPSLFRKIGAGPGILKNVYDNTYVGCCLAFSRGLLDVALPFPPGIPMHDMWLGLLAEIFGSVEFVPGTWLAYRRHGANATPMRRQFRPLTQIRRRWTLATSLARRTLERRRCAPSP